MSAESNTILLQTKYSKVSCSMVRLLAINTTKTYNDILSGNLTFNYNSGIERNDTDNALITSKTYSYLEYARIYWHIYLNRTEKCSQPVSHIRVWPTGVLEEHPSPNTPEYIWMDSRERISECTSIDWWCRYGQEYDCNHDSWDTPAKWTSGLSSILYQGKEWSVYCHSNNIL